MWLLLNNNYLIYKIVIYYNKIGYVQVQKPPLLDKGINFEIGVGATSHEGGFYTRIKKGANWYYATSC